jgi:hypothetical protein
MISAELVSDLTISPELVLDLMISVELVSSTNFGLIGSNARLR